MALEPSPMVAPDVVDPTSPASPVPPPDGRTAALFLLAAFAWSWACWGLGALRADGPVTAAALGGWLFAAAFGPALGAVLALALTRGGAGVRALFACIARVDLGWSTWLLALYHAAPFALLALLAFSLGHTRDAIGTSALLFFLPLIAVFSLLPGPLGGEPGWRGLLLPVLLTRFAPLPAALLVGLVWAAWQAPLWWLDDLRWGLALAQFVPVQVFTLLAMSLILAVFHLRSGGSLALSVMIHAAFVAVLGPFVNLAGRGMLLVAPVLAYALALTAAAVVLTWWHRGLLIPHRQGR